MYSDLDKDLNAEVDVIINPFDISPDNPLSRKYLANYIKENITLNLMDLNQQMLPLWEFFESVVLGMPIDVLINNALVTKHLLGIYELEIEDGSEDLLELLIKYIKTMVNVSEKRIFIFLHIKQFLTPGKLKDLYDFSHMEEVSLFLIESSVGKTEPREKLYVLDKDLCEIY